MTNEDRLRRALRDEAASVGGAGDGGDAWGAVRRETARRRSARRRRLAGAAAAAVVLVVGGIVGVVALGDDDPATTVAVGPDGSTSTTSSSSSSTSTSSTVPEDAPPLGPIWPFASYEELQAYRSDPGVGMFFDAEATALEFAREYLSMPAPEAVGAVGEDGTSLYLDVVPRAGAPMVTRVRLFAYDGVHTVFAAETANIVPLTPVVPVGLEIPLKGTSTAFEAHVDVAVRDAHGTELGRTFVMGGANGELGPFDGSITISAPSTEVGALVFSTSSAEDGSVQEATVVAIRFSPSVIDGDGAGARSFSVFFHRGEELVEVRRSGPPTVGVLRQALDALVAGPLPSDGPGLTSLFSSATADVIAGVSVGEDGLAVVDLARTVDNASTSAGSAALLESLDATVFQFPTVERIEYRLSGSCEAFWTWLQMDGCQIVAR